MSIHQTSRSIASLLEQELPASNQSAAAQSASGAGKQVSSFQSQLEASQASAAPAPSQVESSAPSAAPAPQPAATPFIVVPANSTTEQPVPLAGTPSAGVLDAIADSPELTPSSPWPITVVTPNPPPELAGQAKTALRQALGEAGIDPDSVKMAYWEELVWYPGGSYINRNLTVQSPGGKKADFDAAATVRSPWLTASWVTDHISAA